VSKKESARKTMGSNPSTNSIQKDHQDEDEEDLDEDKRTEEGAADLL
jgi:hypothetical protein